MRSAIRGIFAGCCAVAGAAAIISRRVDTIEAKISLSWLCPWSVIVIITGYRITRSARASTRGGIPSIFGFEILGFGWSGHRITRSALANRFGGIVNPICLAVLRLITSSNFVGCSTGISDGFAPLRILSNWTAARRMTSAPSGP